MLLSLEKSIIELYNFEIIISKDFYYSPILGENNEGL